MTVLDWIKNYIKDMDKMFDEFKESYERLKYFDDVYSDKENKKRREDLKAEWAVKAKGFIDDIKGRTKGHINYDISKIKLPDKKQQENLNWLNSDLTTVLNLQLKDKEAFLIVQKYIGDMDIMKRFALCPHISKLKTTSTILQYAFALEKQAGEIEKIWQIYLQTYSKLFPFARFNSEGYVTSLEGSFDGITSNSRLGLALKEKELFTATEKFLRIIDYINMAKTATFEEVTKKVADIYEALAEKSNTTLLSSDNELIREGGDVYYN